MCGGVGQSPGHRLRGRAAGATPQRCRSRPWPLAGGHRRRERPGPAADADLDGPRQPSQRDAAQHQQQDRAGAGLRHPLWRPGGHALAHRRPHQAAGLRPRTLDPGDARCLPRLRADRPPSAELKPDQVDPFDYPTVAPALERLVRANRSNAALRRSEHKRWHHGIILKVSEKAFGTGRLIPVTRR